MVANSESRDIAEAKEILINSVKLDYFEPSDSLSWQSKYKKYLKVLKIRRENIDG
jgi:hypothetical protein